MRRRIFLAAAVSLALRAALSPTSPCRPVPGGSSKA
jgi:hypothetical protein